MSRNSTQTIRWFGGLLLIAVASGAATASACINDREVGLHEQLFKSRYNEDPPTEPGQPQLQTAPHSSGELILAGGLGLGAGSVLIGSALLLGAWRRSTTSEEPEISAEPAPTDKGPRYDGEHP